MTDDPPPTDPHDNDATADGLHPAQPLPRSPAVAADASAGDGTPAIDDATTATIGDATAAAVDGAWATVVANWDDEEAHSRFLALCVQLERMPDAGRRYRHVRETDADRAREAGRRIDKLVSYAMANMLQQRTEPTQSPRRLIVTIAAVFMLGSILVATWTLLRFAH